MKLLLLSVCVLVLVAFSYAKPCPRCKRMIMGQYSDYDEYDNGGYNVGDTRRNQNGGPTGGRPNGPTGGRPNGPTGNRPYGNRQNRPSDCPNCYAYDFGNGDYNQNTINVEKK